MQYNSKSQFAGKVFAESTETFNKWTQCYTTSRRRI